MVGGLALARRTFSGNSVSQSMHRHENRAQPLRLSPSLDVIVALSGILGICLSDS